MDQATKGNIRRRSGEGKKVNPKNITPEARRDGFPRNFKPDALDENDARYVPTDWDESLPYGGKVYLARQKKPDSWACIILQIFLVAMAVGLMYYGWYYTEHLHYHATKLYASYGHREAQAIIGHKLLHGQGIEKNQTEAMMWLHEAAKQGHPHSAYNVAIGQMQGMHSRLQPGEAKRLIKHAADNGVEEAIAVYERACSRGRCDS